MDDQYWMARALALAERAAEQGEVPVGAVLVRDGEIIGEGYNRPILSHDPSAHAEIGALRDAAARAGNYRLPDSTLYVTIEPCTMCFGAMIHARVARLVYGAREPRAGVCESQLGLPERDFYNHRLEVTGGVLADQASQLMRDFFRRKRTGN
ncbi:tRNA adenosine(34) deaminase TadA [Alloalcanivorax xenomutans]